MSTAEHAATGTVDAAWLAEHTGTGQPVRILDVRTPAEFETAHIRGSYNIPLGILQEHRNELAAALDNEVVLVCRSGQRSEQAGDALAQAGLANLKILPAGSRPGRTPVRTWSAAVSGGSWSVRCDWSPEASSWCPCPPARSRRR